MTHCILIIAEVKWSLILSQEENNNDFYSKSSHSDRMLHFQFRFYFIFKGQVGKSQITINPKHQLNVAPHLCAPASFWLCGIQDSWSQTSLRAHSLPLPTPNSTHFSVYHLGDKFQVILLSSSKYFIAQERLKGRTWGRGEGEVKRFFPLPSFS